jgi:hypothetical protein
MRAGAEQDIRPELEKSIGAKLRKSIRAELKKAAKDGTDGRKPRKSPKIGE